MPQNRNFPDPSACFMPGEADGANADYDADYQWAEYNLPVTSATKSLPGEESGDELAFLRFAVETDLRTFDN